MMDETSEKFIHGKIVRGESPLNLEMPFEKLEAFITPTELFYVRTHFPIPNIDRDAWWVRIEGAVEKPYAINYEQLLELRSVTIPVTLECAGNNRDFLQKRRRVRRASCTLSGVFRWRKRVPTLCSPTK
jgi:DMSO/TMAO reductase YedYZ molybdopterin-dependent catalytic subunit